MSDLPFIITGQTFENSYIVPDTLCMLEDMKSNLWHPSGVKAACGDHSRPLLGLGRLPVVCCIECTMNFRPNEKYSLLGEH